MVIKKKKEHSGEPGDVIDLGGPRRRRLRAPYTPNARLYPGLRDSKKKPKGSDTKIRRKKKMRPASQLVPNPRLYQARPRRQVAPPPPAWPAVSWTPRAPTACLETASGAALRLVERRAELPAPTCCAPVAHRPARPRPRPRRARRRAQRPNLT
ncbi:PREDICTED: translation initiation factor IF-2-like [Papilio polytes]|uniref:translation initiation factor IF-2-like n=1 Tax=Papilio polytes TaxID=76194 RepID=UPI00067689D0|nr:PREDICTED: translation initiation factor IF-2-like [Papilio polytes]